MVHIHADAQGRARVPYDRTRLNFGCYNFDIAEDCTLNFDTEEALIIPPLCFIAVPDQVGVRATGGNSQRNYWLTSISAGEVI